MKKVLLVTIAMATAATMATASMSNTLSEEDTSTQQWTAQTVVTSDLTTDKHLKFIENADHNEEGYTTEW